MALGDDESTPRAYATAFGLRSGTRGWFIISSCHWLTIIGELRSLWFAIRYRFCNPIKSFSYLNIFAPAIFGQSATDDNYIGFRRSKGLDSWHIGSQLRILESGQWIGMVVKGRSIEKHLKLSPSGSQWIMVEVGTRMKKQAPIYPLFQYLSNSQCNVK